MKNNDLLDQLAEDDPELREQLLEDSVMEVLGWKN